MRKFSIIFFTILITIGCDNTNDVIINDLINLNLKDNVKTVYDTIFNIEVKFGEPVKTSIRSSKSHSFNNKGYLTEEREYGESELIYSINKTYNQKQQVIDSTYSGDVNLIKTKYEYDKNDKLKLIIEIYSSGSKAKFSIDTSLTIYTSFYYNNQGKLDYKDRLYSDSSLSSRSKSIYDNKGKLVQENGYNGDGSEDYSYKFNYHSNGVIELNQLYYKHEGRNMELAIEKSYDDKGLIIEIFRYGFLLVSHEPSFHSHSEFNYDKRGNLIEELSFREKGEIAYQKHFKYDENNNIVEFLERFSFDGLYVSYDDYSKFTVTRTNYEYDSHMNWIKRIDYYSKDNLNKTFNSISERTIEYYK